jgi:hypothetical protein
MVLSNEEFILLCSLKRRLFTPFEVVVDKIFSGSFEKARDTVNVLVKRNMVEHWDGRVIITAVGKKATNSEQIKRKATILMIVENAE